MAGATECWVTTGLVEEQCISALVLAKSLKRVMTLRKLVILISSMIPQELCEILQVEFDVCIRLDSERILTNGLTAEMHFKLHCWSLVKWKKIIFLDPCCLLKSDHEVHEVKWFEFNDFHPPFYKKGFQNENIELCINSSKKNPLTNKNPSMNSVVRNCDEVFKLDGFRYSSDFSMFVLIPSLETWKTLTKVENAGNMDCGKILENLSEKGLLDVKFNRNVDLLHGSLATNLDEITIISFNGVKPLDIYYQNDKEMITGYFEKALFDLWRNHLENEVAQTLKELTFTRIQFSSGLKNCLEQYKIVKIPSPVNDNDLPKESIAIVGISCRFPGANNLDEFWKLLVEGGDAMGRAPHGRWIPERCVNVLEDAKNSTGGFLNFSLDEFDGHFFGFSPSEIAFMDPQQRLTLQVAWEALEDAGINPLSLENTFTGVFGGAWRLEYEHFLQRTEAHDKEFIRSYLGNSFGGITARISHFLGLTGPSIGTDSACSSSMVAVDLACKSLAKGETDLSLAFGVNLLLRPFTKETMNPLLAEDGHCKTFDKNADGFARAEGCGVLVLKRYADAVKDGDRIWGLIRGTGVVQEGASRSLGTPTKYCEALAMKMALENANVKPKEVSFVETHGTGTPVGDPIEVAAIAEVYSKGRQEPLIIGSVKTNIGHTESCSGIAGIIKVILSMKNELIPPHKNFKTLNPNINLKAVPAIIPLEAVEWKRDLKGKPRIAGVSSFGITGTEAHVIIQETPEVKIYQFAPKMCLPRPCHILTLSAKTPEALEGNLENFKLCLTRTDVKFGDVAHTANIGRGDFPFRACVVGDTNSNVLENMKNVIKNTTESPPKICFLFTGQGSQYPGMAKSLYDHNPIFKINFDICDAHLSKIHGISIREALWGTNMANLSRTIYSQTSIFCVEYCLFKLWESWGIKPDFVLGHSLGEYAAAVAAGIISFEDALKLVGERSRLIEGLDRGKMLVLKESFQVVESLVINFFKGTDEWLDFAAINSPEQTVLAGSEENIEAFSEFCKTKNIKSLVLEASHAFHSRHMDPVLENYRNIASSVKYSKATCVYVSGMEGRVVEEESYVNADYWVRHTRESVQFLNASKAILGLGCTLFLEIGPQPVLSAMIMINSEEVSGIQPVTCLSSIKKQNEDWSTILNSLGKLYLNGVNVNWKRFDQFENLKTVTAPFYPFQGKKYWYEIPYQGPGQIHPLVGTAVSNPSNLKIFKNKIELKNLNFLKDHLFGSKIVYPGAGYIEMCLVSGHAATMCTETAYFGPSAPITLENVLIESPLGLEEHENTELQTVVTMEDSGETKITIYSKVTLDKETQKWVRHASASFSPYAVQTKQEDLSNNQNIEELLKRCGEKIMIEDTYKRLSNVGIKFGPTFKSLSAMWKGEKEVCFEVKVPDETKNYVCHPVLLDALLQAILFTKNPNIKSLHVPISLTKLIWFSKFETEKCYIHCVIESDDAVVAVLYDENGQIIAKMIGATFMETTVGVIMSSLEAQRISFPSMYENVWRPQIGPMERRVNLSEILSGVLFEDAYNSQITTQFNTLNKNDKLFNTKSNKLYGFYMIKCLYDLGWIPVVGMIYNLREMITLYKIKPSLEGLFRYIFMTLSEYDGLFKITNAGREEMSFELMQMPGSLTEVLESIEDLYAKVYPISPEEVELVSITGRNLSNFITGKESALSVLFPEHRTNKVSADSFYVKAKMLDRCRTQTQLLCAEMLSTCSKMLKERKGFVRILEVGAGTGSTTKSLLPLLEEFPEGYEYTYTDISPSFFQNGSEICENSKIRILFRLFDIEKDVASQGFIPHHYDIILANNVIHASKSISESIRNLRNVLRGDGVLLIIESIKPSRNTNLLFGLLGGYWSFRDYDLRPYNCEISLEKWKEMLTSQNFKNVVCYPCYDNALGFIVSRNQPSEVYVPPTGLKVAKSSKIWILFSDESEISKYFYHKLEELGNKVAIVTICSNKDEKSNDFSYLVPPADEKDMINLFESLTNKSKLTIEGVVFLWGLNYESSDYESICNPFLSLCKLLIPQIKPKLFVITRGVSGIGDNGVSNPVPSLLHGMTKSFQNEKPDSTCRCIDLDESTVLHNPSINNLKEAFSELFVDDGEIVVSYRGNQRNVFRLVPWKVQNTALSLPKSERFRLILAPSNKVSDLRFGMMEKACVGKAEIEICVKAYGLNFRDIFTVLKASPEFEHLNTVGLDFSGVITSLGSKVTQHKVGDAVLGVNLTGDSLSSHLVMKEGLVINKPDNMSFNDAATLPLVASTAFLSLIKVAKLTKNDTILIHTASGGVGLVAIQIALSVGATIVVTAGSQRKRNYLKNLGLEYIFHSRNTNFEQDIRNALNGRGVDVVLNSLTSVGFKEASLNVCNEGARFIEMSKLNTWTPEEVKILRPDVKYEIVDLSAVTDTEMAGLMVDVQRIMDKGIITSIPYVRFDASEIRQALTTMHEAKHIGKIVCTMPQSNLSFKRMIPIFNNESTYLITGGLGGIGFEVCKWMLEAGAKNIALVGRKPPKDVISSEIQRLKSQGFNVFPLQFDVGNMEKCRELLQVLKSSERNLPPLRGIMHAAGVLADAVFENQNRETYEKTYNPKVRGGWNLHQCTLNYQLEHFVMFSSVAACLGAIGQSNHVSANAYLDSLAAYRNSIGLPATTINWGQWGQVGVAANIAVVGLKPFTSLQGITALQEILRSQRNDLSVCEIEFNLARQVFPTTKRYFEEIKNVEDKGEVTLSKEKFWLDYDSAVNINGKVEAAKTLVRSVIHAILKLDNIDNLKDDEDLKNLGLDSLMMIEMKNAIQTAFGSRATIGLNSITDSSNINTLSIRLTQIISGEVQEQVTLTREELVKLIREDSQLPMDIKPHPTTSSYCKPSEIKTILMTGATGNLGPHILKDILQRHPHVQKMICLVRGQSNKSCQERLEQILESKGLLNQIPMEKVECVDGSITKSHLGLTQDKYRELSEKTDAIVHLAVNSNLILGYRKIEDDRSLRTVNVLGTNAALFHASSIIANGKLDGNKCLSESWPHPQDFDELFDMGYAVSKFICDLLIRQASERGLPVKVFRFPMIGGDSVTGNNVDIDNNQLLQRLMSYLHLGYMLDITLPFAILPVDVCSDLSLKIFFNDKTEYGVYNVYSPYPTSELEFVSMAEEMGYKLEVVDLPEFQKRIGEKEDSLLIHFIKQLTEKDNQILIRLFSHPPPVVEAFETNPQNGFFSKKLAEFIPEYPSCIESTLSIIKRDLIYAKNSGAFDRYGV